MKKKELDALIAKIKASKETEGDLKTIVDNLITS
jgi:hypothetical protein